MGSTVLQSKWGSSVVAAVVAMGVVLYGLQVPLGDDDLFWWVPKSIWFSEHGWSFVASLPEAALMSSVDGVGLPAQWADGLPDYGHPPLWFWWVSIFISIFGQTSFAAHLAVLPLAALLGWGVARLLHRTGGSMASWLAPAVILLPSIQAQLVAVDTDIPLLALSVWSLVAIIDRNTGLFVITSGLAVWCKEPGVLLFAPALIVAIYDRRWSWSWAAPIVMFAAWGVVHWSVAGWAFAGSERLPSSFSGWVSDLLSVGWFLAVAQGRWVICIIALYLLLKRWPSLNRSAVVVFGYLVSQVLFYSTFNYLGGVERESKETHLRYLNGALLATEVSLLAVSPIVVGVPMLVTSLWGSKRAVSLGPEGSMCGAETETSMVAASDFIRSAPGPIWVGSYAYAQLTRPFAGVVDAPVLGLNVYGPDTDPSELSGLVVQRAHGEPLGRLQELDLTETERFGGDCGWVSVMEVGEVLRSPPVP